jgi:hypothetical protein
MEYIINRLKEPSTWAGLAVVFTAFGISVSEAELALVGSGVAAVLAIILRERGGE